MPHNQRQARDIGRDGFDREKTAAFRLEESRRFCRAILQLGESVGSDSNGTRPVLDALWPSDWRTLVIRPTHSPGPNVHEPGVSKLSHDQAGLLSSVEGTLRQSSVVKPEHKPQVFERRAHDPRVSVQVSEFTVESMRAVNG